MAKKQEGNAAAREMSKLGASKGGKARANTLTVQERREIARNAVRARWLKAGKLKQIEEETDQQRDGDEAQEVAPVIPFSMLRGPLAIGDVELECHVLNDGRRVFTQGEVVRVLTGGTDSSNLKRYLRRNPLFGNDFSGGPIFQFRVPGNPQLATGYEATHLIEICEKYLEARDQKLLHSSQLHLAAKAEIVIRSCAKVGIIALVDEATGYQQLRAKRALQLKIQAFIAEELQDWARMFQEEFWLQLARLEGIRYSPRSRPLRWGKYVMMFVYDAIDKDVGIELRKKNPNPHFLKNHHQWLQKFGRDQVHDQIERVITIMKLCDDMDDFRKKFAKVFKKTDMSQTYFDWMD
jgi:hypothetical protein